jgi:hypothetical protein
VLVLGLSTFAQTATISARTVERFIWRAYKYLFVYDKLARLGKESATAPFCKWRSIEHISAKNCPNLLETPGLRKVSAPWKSNDATQRNADASVAPTQERAIREQFRVQPCVSRQKRVVCLDDFAYRWVLLEGVLG